jgi:hypothetical protein
MLLFFILRHICWCFLVKFIKLTQMFVRPRLILLFACIACYYALNTLHLYLIIFHMLFICLLYFYCGLWFGFFISPKVFTSPVVGVLVYTLSESSNASVSFLLWLRDNISVFLLLLRNNISVFLLLLRNNISVFLLLLWDNISVFLLLLRDNISVFLLLLRDNISVFTVVITR